MEIRRWRLGLVITFEKYVLKCRNCIRFTANLLGKDSLLARILNIENPLVGPYAGFTNPPVGYLCQFVENMQVSQTLWFKLLRFTNPLVAANSCGVVFSILLRVPDLLLGFVLIFDRNSRRNIKAKTTWVERVGVESKVLRLSCVSS